jgi:hypothetical protein
MKTYHKHSFFPVNQYWILVPIVFISNAYK